MRRIFIINKHLFRKEMNNSIFIIDYTIFNLVFYHHDHIINMLYFLREVIYMDFKYRENRIYVHNEEGKMIVEATFPLYKKGVVVVDHTYVDPSLRGKGVASELMKEVCKKIESLGLKVIATCPYAVVWFKRHKAYDYLIDQETQAEVSPECQI